MLLPRLPFVLRTPKSISRSLFQGHRRSTRITLANSNWCPATFVTMPPKKQAAKRKSASPVINGAQNKKAKTSHSSSNGVNQYHPLADEAEKNGIVIRKYYPPEMSNARAKAYSNDEIPRPIEELHSALHETADERNKVKVKDAVVHWFKMDLRQTDNKALALATEKAKQAGVPLICMYLVSPQDYEAHLRSAPRVDFMLRTLEVLKEDLAKLDIPLYVETVEKRKQVPDRILELMEEWGASHIYANIEYEVDELRREAHLVRDLAENGKAFEVVHDSCVVPPGELVSGSGKQYAVYSPWYRSWVAHIHDNLDLLELFDAPSQNPESARKTFKKLFDCPIPDAPKNKVLNAEERKRYRSFWPAGEHEALNRLDKFCQEKVSSYADGRNLPAANGTSCISVHLSAGTISGRTCVRVARDRNKTKKLNGGNPGIISWISEVAWRDFYKHVLANWPYIW